MLKSGLHFYLDFLIFIPFLAIGCQSSPHVNLEAISPLTNRPVKELDALQTTSGAIVAATMERAEAGIPENICQIYRSTDQGENWHLVFTLEDTSRYTRQYADPRLIEDPQTGKIYLVLMQVRLPDKPNPAKQYRREYYLGDIVVFQSENDGQTWQYQSTPHSDPIGIYGDLPFPVVDRQGCLWIFHSKLDIRKLIAPSEIIVHRSCDGGSSWTESYAFTDTLIPSSRKNLGNLVVMDQQTIAGTFTDQENLYYFELDYGENIFLKKIENIPISFGGIRIPIAYLSQQQATNQLGIISYLPHQVNSPIWYSSKLDNETNWYSQNISKGGAYPNVLMLPEGEIMITFNRRSRDNFQLMYTASQNGGQDFSDPLPLFQAKYRFSENGEYQALFVGEDGQKHLLFCDWSDYSKAKHALIIIDH